ncbi:uncharacterized protein ATC70_007238 [Mucor velutinosus]|uniref:Uncharacterized protein n=1 Tax=Mucor velutinosus TaxID=708070 RepID=A0AAN7DC04_9FUNG|nr:hypothetical protein ATC70_007238 [Mucor velutinosus]
MNLGVNQRIEKKQEEYQSYFKQKADTLTLKTKPDRKVEWPIKSYQNRVNIKKRRLYLDTSEESVAKVGITKHRQFKRTAWDPQMNRKTDFNNFSKKKSKLDTSIMDDLVNFVNCSKSSAQNKKEMDTIDNQDTSLIKNLSLKLIDQVLMNIANPMDKDSNEPKKDLDWEFMLANILQTNLPKPVIERVKRHMALATGKRTPAITALNVTPCQISDLTISNTELEMKATLRELYAQTETESFEPLPDGDVYEDIKWLMDLSRKDSNDQISEIATINEEYSNRVLNLKPAFF